MSHSGNNHDGSADHLAMLDPLLAEEPDNVANYFRSIVQEDRGLVSPFGDDPHPAAQVLFRLQGSIRDLLGDLDEDTPHGEDGPCEHWSRRGLKDYHEPMPCTRCRLLDDVESIHLVLRGLREPEER